jgi:hypothetical protein
MSGFVDVSKDAFAFLQDDYGFSLESSGDERWGAQLIYRNPDRQVGIKLVYDFSNAFVFVFVYRLIEGELIDNELPITDESEITCLDLNDLLDERRKMKPAYDYSEDSAYFDESHGLKNYVMEFANRLENEGRPFLQGDFSRLPEAEMIIKARARQLRQAGS